MQKRDAICYCRDCQAHARTTNGVVVDIVNERFRLFSGKLKTSRRLPTAALAALSPLP